MVRSLTVRGVVLRSLTRAAFGLAWAITLLFCGRATAQEAVLAEFYGSGVHHYFAGNMAQSIADLSVAVQGGSKDPRVYYFRALAGFRQGQQGQATIDLMMGAKLETADVNQFYPVGKALERVQGSSRMTIERYRTVARAEAFERQQRRDISRYEQQRRAEAEVLRNPAFAPAVPAAPAPLGGAPAPGKVVPPPPQPEEDLFNEDEKAPAKRPPPPDADEPAADEPAAEMPADEPGVELPADEPAADAKTGDGDPFVDDKEQGK